MEPALEAVAVLRHSIWQHGYRPLAILSRDKRPIGNEWGNRARQTPPECLRLDPVPHALSTGILCDGLRAIDVDVDDPIIAARCVEIIEDMLGIAPIRSRADSPRRLLVYRAAAGEPSKRYITGKNHSNTNALKIEALGRGQQFLAFGVHPDGAELQWLEGSPRTVDLADIPAVTEDQITKLFAALAPIIGAEAPTTNTTHQSSIPPGNGHDHDRPEELEASDHAMAAQALLAIPNGPDKPASWEDWNRIGMAFWAATAGSETGWQAWDAWSAQHPSYDPDHTRERWQHYGRSPPSRIGAGTIFHLAEQAGWARPSPKPFGLLQERSTDQQSAEFPATSQNWEKMKSIGPREWVYGHFLIRRFVSVLGAPGGTGKTAYSYAIGYAVAADLPLLGETVHESGKVWLYNLEDPIDELSRRSNAAVIHHKIERQVVEEQFFLDSGRDRELVVAVLDPQGRVIATPIVDLVIAEIRRRNIVLMIIDPFIRSHNLIENANDQINFALNQWSRIADEAACAILLVHHFRKGGTAGDAAAFRGASALIDAARAAITLAPMSEEEADRLGVETNQCWQYVRADNAKLNLAPPPEHTTWLRLVSVPLGNSTDLRLEDQVQTVEPWSPPSPWDGLTMPMCIRILDRIKAGPGEGEQFTATRRGSGNARWAGNVVMDVGSQTEGQAAQVIRKWVEEKLLIATKYDSPANRRETTGLTVNDAKLAEMRATVFTSDRYPSDEN